MNRQEIITVLRELHRISGFRISLHGADFHEIAAYPESMCEFCSSVHKNKSEHLLCVECDTLACHKALTNKDTYIYKCRYGLTEAVSPLYNFGTLSGFLMMGQVAESERDLKRAKSRIANILPQGADISELCDSITLVNPEMVSSFVKIMTICAEYLTLSNSVMAEKRTIAEEASRYINANLDKKFGIPDICRHIGCSKSTLITAFKKKYGMTVNSFITDLRLKKAQGLLYEGKMSIAEISSACGFSDQSYFSKVFCAKHKIPPTEYRAKHDSL